MPQIMYVLTQKGAANCGLNCLAYSISLACNEDLAYVCIVNENSSYVMSGKRIFD